MVDTKGRRGNTGDSKEEGDMPEAKVKVKVRKKVLLVACPRGSTKR
jgi:hypothetical protein